MYVYYGLFSIAVLDKNGLEFIERLHLLKEGSVSEVNSVLDTSEIQEYTDWW